MEKIERKQIRCAIYTRVSTSEGLEQEFTSLDNQRESAESYIESQKSEGWLILPEKYDDGGYTGANTERPALQRLLADIKEGNINCVVVYKVDRLSRSLLDFSQLLEFFDKNNVTFVSVTQAFNTNTSMGRLTLNILLSFAQFEREIISERTRDKMGAAKKKGKWIGGRPSLGYDIDRIKHKLIANPKEAEIVREIFNLYLEKRSLLAVAIALNDKRYTTKHHITPEGKTAGGVKFENGTVQIILKNILYTGKVMYNGKLYQGEQEAIISDDIFQKVQELLAKNKPTWKMPKTKKHIGILSGILHCKACNCAMYYSYSMRAGKYKYCYYLCMNASKRGYKSCPTKLLNAQKIEQKIVELLRSITPMPAFDEEAWNKLTLQEKISTLKSIVKEIGYDGNKQILEIVLKNDDKKHEFKVELKELKNTQAVLTKQDIQKEPVARQGLILAHNIQEVIARGQAKDLKQIAGWLGITHIKVYLIMNILMLAPTIQEEILLSNDKNISSVPEYKINEISRELDWEKQKEMWQKLTNNPA